MTWTCRCFYLSKGVKNVCHLPGLFVKIKQNHHVFENYRVLSTDGVVPYTFPQV